LGYHGLNTLPLIKLSQLNRKGESLTFRKKPAAKLVPVDFQEYLISSLLLLCKKAQFLNLPLEKPKVPQSRSKCDKLDYTHFQKMPTLRFKFAKENAELVRTFMLNLDNQAEIFDIEEKQGFADARFTNPIHSRNSYLNR
jgi:hypothetical protein